MKKLQFKKDFKAAAEKVFNTMLGIDDIKTYEWWTKEFNPNSTYEGSWEKGAKIAFIGTDPNGNRGGMLSEIVENIPHKFVSIRHYGLIDGDKEITQGKEVEKWAGAFENYTFDEKDGITTLTVETETTEDFIVYFNTTWPGALGRLKELVEK